MPSVSPGLKPLAETHINPLTQDLASLMTHHLYEAAGAVFISSMSLGQ